MRSVRRTTWKIKREVVTVLRTHAYGVSNDEAFYGVGISATCADSADPGQQIERLELRDEDPKRAIKKSENEHE